MKANNEYMIRRNFKLTYIQNNIANYDDFFAVSHSLKTRILPTCMIDGHSDHEPLIIYHWVERTKTGCISFFSYLSVPCRKLMSKI